MRAVDPGNINKNATGSSATGNPNEFNLLDLTPLLGSAGSYTNKVTGNTDFGPYPSNMTARDAFRGPGKWNIDFGVNKRFRFGSTKAEPSGASGSETGLPSSFRIGLACAAVASG